MKPNCKVKYWTKSGICATQKTFIWFSEHLAFSLIITPVLLFSNSQDLRDTRTTVSQALCKVLGLRR